MEMTFWLERAEAVLRRWHDMLLHRL